MARIIDLKKNKQEHTKPETGSYFAEHKHAEEPKPWRPEQEVSKKETEPVEETVPAPADYGVIAWTGQLYHHLDVKLAVGISVLFFVIAVLVQIFQKNVITTIFFGLVGVVILLNVGKKPKPSYFEINPVGVRAYDKLYTYKEIKSFWIEYDLSLGIQELSLQLKRWYVPYLKIPIEGQNPVQVRTALIGFIPEVEHRDTLVEILSRKIGM